MNQAEIRRQDSTSVLWMDDFKHTYYTQKGATAATNKTSTKGRNVPNAGAGAPNAGAGGAPNAGVVLVCPNPPPPPPKGVLLCPNIADWLSCLLCNDHVACVVLLSISYKEMEGTKNFVQRRREYDEDKLSLLLDLVVANTVCKRVHTNRKADPSIKEIDRENRIAKARSQHNANIEITSSLSVGRGLRHHSLQDARRGRTVGTATAASIAARDLPSLSSR